MKLSNKPIIGPNFYETIDLEFLKLSHKCLSLPVEETMTEWKEKNRYSNNQPCMFLYFTFIILKSLSLDNKYRIRLLDKESDYINATNWQVNIFKFI